MSPEAITATKPVCSGKRRDDHEPERCNSYCNKQGDISVLITGADGKRVQAEIQGMGTFSPGTDANGPSFWPRGSSDVRQTPHCLFWNDGWRCRFLELGYGRLPWRWPKSRIALCR